MVTMGVFPCQGKTHMVEPGIEPGTSWLVVRSSDHQATRLVTDISYKTEEKLHLDGLGVGRRLILKWIFEKKNNARAWTGFI